MTSTHTEPAAADAGTSRNVLGLIALITAIIGAIFACVPGALIVGWVLLPIAFILSLVALFQRGRKRGTAVTALILSVVGTVIGVIVFFAVIADAFNDSFNEETTVSAPENDEEADTADQDAGAPAGDGSTEEEAAEAAGSEDQERGTRANPYALGAEISSSDWTVSVNSVDLDATAAIEAENPMNESPDEGHTYILAEVTAQYDGDDAEGSTPMLSVAYVSPDGNTFNSHDRTVVAPESFDSLSTLYEGASTSGNIALHVPTEGLEDGVLSVDASLFSDTVFVAVD